MGPWPRGCPKGSPTGQHVALLLGPSNLYWLFELQNLATSLFTERRYGRRPLIQVRSTPLGFQTHISRSQMKGTHSFRDVLWPVTGPWWILSGCPITMKKPWDKKYQPKTEFFCICSLVIFRYWYCRSRYDFYKIYVQIYIREPRKMITQWVSFKVIYYSLP